MNRHCDFSIVDIRKWSQARQPTGAISLVQGHRDSQYESGLLIPKLPKKGWLSLLVESCSGNLLSYCLLQCSSQLPPLVRMRINSREVGKVTLWFTCSYKAVLRGCLTSVCTSISSLLMCACLLGCVCIINDGKVIEHTVLRFMRCRVRFISKPFNRATWS